MTGDHPFFSVSKLCVFGLSGLRLVGVDEVVSTCFYPINGLLSKQRVCLLRFGLNIRYSIYIIFWFLVVSPEMSSVHHSIARKREATTSRDPEGKARAAELGSFGLGVFLRNSQRNQSKNHVYWLVSSHLHIFVGEGFLGRDHLLVAGFGSGFLVWP